MLCRTLPLAAIVAAAVLALPALAEEAAVEMPKPDADGFFPLFNGKDLTGWKVSESPDTFKVQDGAIVTRGPRAHAFYAGPVGGADFKDFELMAEVRTEPGSNSGLYFHTAYQETGYPAKGHEAQVNNSYVKDPRKTGSLYQVKDVAESPVKDGEWFTYHIIVKGKQVTLKVNGKVTADWTQPDDYKPPEKRPGRALDHGTIALQGHDPGSVVWFRNIRIKPLK